MSPLHEPATAREPVSVRLADVEPELVRWLWPGRIPLGKVAVLDGDPGVGKSTLTLDVAARVTTGSPMPDGTVGDLGEGADVVVVSAEDGAGDVIRPRADAAGANVARVHLLTDVASVDEDGRTQVTPWSMPRDLDALEELVRRTATSLVVVDPLNAVLASSVDSYRDQDVRGALRPLAAVAERTGAAILVVRHLSKSGGANALYRGGGSIGIIGAARAGLLVAPDPDDESGLRRILAMTKSNLAEIPPALAYELVSSPEHGCARIRWGGATAHTARTLLVEPVDADERSALDDACQFLSDLLGDGPVGAKDVEGHAQAAGVASRTLRRAKTVLGVRSDKQPTGQWAWVLPEDGQAGRSAHLGHLGHLGHLRADQGVCGEQHGQHGQGGHPGELATFEGSAECNDPSNAEVAARQGEARRKRDQARRCSRCGGPDAKFKPLGGRKWVCRRCFGAVA